MPENSDVDSVNDIWVRERRNEFREVIDADKDGIVTVEELEVKIYLVILQFPKKQDTKEGRVIDIGMYNRLSVALKPTLGTVIGKVKIRKLFIE